MHCLTTPADPPADVDQRDRYLRTLGYPGWNQSHPHDRPINPAAASKDVLDHHVGVATVAHLQADADPARAHALMRGLYRNQLQPAELENLLCAALLELARRSLSNPGGAS